MMSAHSFSTPMFTGTWASQPSLNHPPSTLSMYNSKTQKKGIPSSNNVKATFPSASTSTSSVASDSVHEDIKKARRQRGPLRKGLFSKEEEEEYEKLKMERQQFEKDEMETKKSLTDDFLKGVCTTKCSRFEYLTRCVQQDVHPLEMENGRPKFEYFVKKYQRSYAGASQHPDDLRPLETLLLTQHYLLDLLRRNPLNRVYAFIWDRFRAIRRDISTQQIMDPKITTIYEQIIRFHLLCLFLRPPELDRFQELTQLNAALSDLLYLYQQGQSSQHEIEFLCYDTLLYVNDAAKRVHLFQTHPFDHPFLHGTRRLLPLMGVSDTKIKSFDFAHYVQALLEVPLGLALVASLHLDRLRRNVLAEMVYTGYHRDGNLATKATVSDLVKAFYFEHDAQCVSFVTYFGVPLMEDHVFGLGDKQHWNRCVVDLKKPEATKFHPHFLDTRLASMSLVDFILGSAQEGSLANSSVLTDNAQSIPVTLHGGSRRPSSMNLLFPPSPKASPIVIKKRTRSPSPFTPLVNGSALSPSSSAESKKLKNSLFAVSSLPPSTSTISSSFTSTVTASTLKTNTPFLANAKVSSTFSANPTPTFSSSSTTPVPLPTTPQFIPSISSTSIPVTSTPTTNAESSFSIPVPHQIKRPLSTHTTPSSTHPAPLGTTASNATSLALSVPETTSLTPIASLKPTIPTSSSMLTKKASIPSSSTPTPTTTTTTTAASSSVINTCNRVLKAYTTAQLTKMENQATHFRNHSLLCSTFRPWRKSVIHHFVHHAQIYTFPNPNEPFPLPSSVDVTTEGYLVHVSDTLRFHFALMWPLLRTRLYALQQIQRRHYVPWVVFASTNHVFALLNAWLQLTLTPFSVCSCTPFVLPMLLDPVPSTSLCPHQVCVELWYDQLQRLPWCTKSPIRALSIPFGDVLVPFIEHWVAHVVAECSGHVVGVRGHPWPWWAGSLQPSLEAWMGDMLESMDWVCTALKKNTIDIGSKKGNVG